MAKNLVQNNNSQTPHQVAEVYIYKSKKYMMYLKPKILISKSREPVILQLRINATKKDVGVCRCYETTGQ